MVLYITKEPVLEDREIGVRSCFVPLTKRHKARPDPILTLLRMVA